MITQKKSFENDSAVSVLVGTLALIAVVVAGTLGIATILGTFSSDVSKHASPDQSVAATQTPVYIAGSDNMLGLTQSLATSYATGNPSIRIVPGAMDPTGLDDALAKKRLDIGMVSGNVGYAALASDPSMKITQIGMSSVVVITNKATPGVSGPVNYADLQNFFNTPMSRTGNIYHVPANPSDAIRLERSDQPEITTEALFNYLAVPVPASGSGNVADENSMIQSVASTSYAIGYTDFSDAETAIQNGQNIALVGFTDPSGTTTYSATYANLAAADKNKYRSINDNSKYPLGLCYPLYYVTTTTSGGIPDPFISFTTSTAARSAFQSANAVSIVDL